MSQQYYRKLEPGEIIAKGDCFQGNDSWQEYSGGIGLPVKASHTILSFRPVQITEAKPEPAAPSVENETYRIWMAGEEPRIATVSTYSIDRRPSDDVCRPPSEDNDGYHDWPQRAKRIVAGQEALKLLENSRCAISGTAFIGYEDVKRILAMLKEGQ